MDHLYQNTVLKNPKSILIILLIALISFGYYSKDFRLDASSETLLIEGDPDLEYLKEVTNRYGSKEFLILTHTPNDGMVTDSAINNLLSLKYKLQSLDWVHSVITLLDIPLLDNSDAPLQERLMNFKTLKDEGVDKKRGFNEILASPVFKNFVISEDGQTSGIIVNIKTNEKLKDIESKSEKEIQIFKENRHLSSQLDLMKTCEYIDNTLTYITTSLTERFESFEKHSQDMWNDINPDTFRKVKGMIASHHATLGGVLCGLAVKMGRWQEKFSDGRGGPVQRSEFVMSEMRAGIGLIEQIEKSAPDFSKI